MLAEFCLHGALAVVPQFHTFIGPICGCRRWRSRAAEAAISCPCIFPIWGNLLGCPFQASPACRTILEGDMFGFCAGPRRLTLVCLPRVKSSGNESRWWVGRLFGTRHRQHANSRVPWALIALRL